MVDVEKVFSAYVKSVGGDIVGELLPKSPDFSNADYIFRKNQAEIVVAELKCLTSDILKEGYQEKLNSLVEIWINKGLIPPFWGQINFLSRNLPPQCQKELFDLLGRRIKKVVVAANKQIRETKEHFGLNEAKGLLLLVNDGNYSLESEVVMFLLNRSIGQHCSSINSAVYFTVNMMARLPGVERDVLVWAPAHRKDITPVTNEFMLSLRDEWVKFHATIIGEPVGTIVCETHQIEKIKFLHPPEPREYYRKSHQAFLNLKRELSKQLDLIASACRLYDHGQRAAALQIAISANLILNGKPSGQSLIVEYFGHSNIRLKSTTMLNMQFPSPHSLGFLGLQASTGEFRPMLDDTSRRELLPFKEWWEIEPIMKLNQANETITRRAVIEAACDDECVQNDKTTLKKYQYLVEGCGLKMVAITRGGNDVRISFKNANLAALRQIGHELLRSEELTALAR